MFQVFAWLFSWQMCVWVIEDPSFHRGSEVRMGRVRPWVGYRPISPVRQWVVGDNIFCGPRYVCRGVTDVCDQVLHVGEAWEQFSLKYQDEGQQLFSGRMSPDLLEWFVWEVSLGN